jgi:hypothetical protein
MTLNLLCSREDMGRLDMSELLSAQIGLPTRCEQTFLKYGCSHVHTTQPFVAYSIRRTAQYIYKGKHCQKSSSSEDSEDSFALYSGISSRGKMKCSNCTNNITETSCKKKKQEYHLEAHETSYSIHSKLESCSHHLFRISDSTESKQTWVQAYIGPFPDKGGGTPGL